MDAKELLLVNTFIGAISRMTTAQERQAEALEALAKSNARLVELQEIIMAKDEYIDEASGD